MMFFPTEVIEFEGCLAVCDEGIPRFCNKNNPYPKIKYAGEWWLGHRLSYNLNVEPIPRLVGRNIKEGIVRHSCDRPWCIDPKHLILGTQKENCEDRSQRSKKWIASRKTCHTPDGLKRLAEAARNRKGEKRPNSWWRSAEGREAIGKISKAAWEEKKQERKAKMKEYWSSDKGRATASERGKGVWARMTPEQRAERSAKIKDSWRDPERRKRAVERRKRAVERVTLGWEKLTLEQREDRSAKMKKGKPKSV